jgi:hypothetical protein
MLIYGQVQHLKVRGKDNDVHLHNFDRLIVCSHIMDLMRTTRHGEIFQSGAETARVAMAF